MSCATSKASKTIAVRKRILAKHMLKSVFSMPNDLFHPVGVVTCIMVFQAGNPHRANFKPYFGYLKDDGFHKKRNQGRVDAGNWLSIKSDWISMSTNRESVAGKSITVEIDANMEWCAEAYIETSYDSLNDCDFVESIKDLVAHYFSIGKLSEIKLDEMDKSDEILRVIPEKWHWFSLSDFFFIVGSKSFTKNQISEIGGGGYPYVVTSSMNNGVEGLYNHWTEQGNVLTIDSATVGSCFYQAFNFSASDHVEKLIPKFEMNAFIGLFVKTVLDLEKFRYGYGRKFAQMRLKRTRIRLPSNNGGEPDWRFMEKFMKSLPYSGNLKGKQNVNVFRNEY